MLPIALDLVASLGGLVVPPLFDFVKKKFIKEENDTPERTIGSLATTKPEVLPQYIDALARLNKSNVELFNRDVIGVPRPWVVDLRASIRPTTVAVGLVILGLGCFMESFKVDPGTRYFLESNISSWFGSRLNTGKS